MSVGTATRVPHLKALPLNNRRFCSTVKLKEFEYLDQYCSAVLKEHRSEGVVTVCEFSNLELDLDLLFDLMPSKKERKWVSLMEISFFDNTPSLMSFQFDTKISN